MITIKVEIDTSNDNDRFRRHVSKAIDIINGSQRYYYVDKDDAPVGTIPEGKIICWDKIRGEIKKN